MKNDLFRVSELFADEMRRLMLPSTAEGLLLAIIYHDERQADAHSENRDGVWCSDTKWASTKELRAMGLAPRSGSARFLRQPVSVLEQSGLFDLIEVARDGKSLLWNLSDLARDLLSGDVYGLASAKDIGACSRAFDAIIYTQTVIRWKMDRPKFRLFPFDSPSGRSCLLGPLQRERFFEAKEMTRLIKPSISKFAKLRKVEYFVEYAQTGSRRGYTEVFLKFRHSATAWQEKDFMRSHPRSHSYMVNGVTSSVSDSFGSSLIVKADLTMI